MAIPAKVFLILLSVEESDVQLFNASEYAFI